MNKEVCFIDLFDPVTNDKMFTVHIKRGQDLMTEANPPIIYDDKGLPLYIEVKSHKLPREGIVVWK